jgi:hypothetical protein
MARYLLPKQQSLPQTTPGQWKELSLTEFTTFVNEMEVSPDSKINVTSIPSPWARMLLFKEAIKSTNHLMHKESMSNILDVLEIIFYYELMNINIEYKKIEIEKNDKNKFLKILYELSPEEIKKDDIVSIGLLIASRDSNDKFVLAGTSPFSLLFTPMNLKHKEGNIVFPRYFRERPVPLKERPKDFQRWINSNFLTKLRRDGNYPDLVKALSDDEGICAESLKESLTEEILLPCDFLKNSPFATMVKKINTKKISSPYLLKATKENEKPPLIIDPSINLYGSEYYNGYNYLQDFKYEELKDSNRDFLPGENIKYPWILPQEDFLQPVLIKYKYLLNSNRLILGSYKGSSGMKYALPLTDKFFNHFNYNDVQDMLSIKEISDKTVRVTLKIPIQNGEYIEIKRDYFQDLTNSKENRIINYDDRDIDTPLPHIMIWPPLPPENWEDSYYAFVYGKRYKDGVNQEEMVPLEFKDQDFKDIKYERSRKADKIEIFRLEKLPTYTVISDIASQGKGLLILNNNSLLRVNKPIKSAKVGIDFGTSHTNIAITIDDSEPEVLKYSSKFSGKNLNDDDFITLISFSDEEVGREQIPILILNYLNQYFLPNSLSEIHNTQSIDMPIPSMILMEGDTDKGDTNEGDTDKGDTNSYKALLNTSIAFSKDDVGFFNYDLDGRTIKKTYVQQTNLKWAPQSIRQQAAKEYLRILLLLLKYELIKRLVDLNKVEYHWAFPKSFSETLINDYKKMWRELVGEGYKVTDESKAALLYFDHKGILHRNNPDIAIIIDTGGGSSDISIWQDGQIHMLYSSLWAGMNLVGFEKDNETYSVIFDSIKNLPSIKRDIFQNIKGFQNQLNYILYSLDETTLSNLARSDSFYKARFLILYFYSALFYEIGIQSRAIDMDNIKKINLLLAGNGSRFSCWSSGAVDKIDEQEQEIYKQVIKKAIPFDKEVEIHTSFAQDKKREVAIGLCKDKEDSKENKGIKNPIITEKVFINANSVPSNMSIEDFNELILQNGHLINIEPNNSEIVNFHNTFFEVLAKSDLYRDRLKNDRALSNLESIKNILIGDWGKFIGELRGVIEDNIKNYTSISSSIFTLEMQISINRLNRYLSKNQ